MRYGYLACVMCIVCWLPSLSATGQEREPAGEAGAGDSTAVESNAVERADQIVSETRGKVEEIAADLDENQQAQEASAGLLRQIYVLAEYFSVPTSHWVAFSRMVTGVVSFALQLVLATLVVLTGMSISV